MELRRARADETGAILELNGACNGDDIFTEMDVAFRYGGMAPDDYAIAVADGRVVATVGLLRTELRVGSVTLPVGQPEYISTDPAYRGQGLARRLLEMVQEWSAARGDLLEIIAGVAFFYRQYGYSYGLVRPPTRAVPPENPIAMPPGWHVRDAEAADVDRIRDLQSGAQAHVDVALPFAANLWSPFLHMAAAPLLVGVFGGRVAAVGRLRVAPGFPVQAQALAASSAHPVAGLQAVLAAAQARFPGATLIVADRCGSATRAAVTPSARPPARRPWLYVRVPSLAAVLSALTPVLNGRLAASAFAEADAELCISQYQSSVRLRIAHGQVVDVAAGAGIHLPHDTGDVGVPPDLVPLLLFGEGGVAALEDHPDVFLGIGAALTTALFPALTVDALTW